MCVCVCLYVEVLRYCSHAINQTECALVLTFTWPYPALQWVCENISFFIQLGYFAFSCYQIIECRSRWPCSLRRRSATARFPGLPLWFPRKAWMFVSCPNLIRNRQTQQIIGHRLQGVLYKIQFYRGHSVICDLLFDTL